MHSPGRCQPLTQWTKGWPGVSTSTCVLTHQPPRLASAGLAQRPNRPPQFLPQSQPLVLLQLPSQPLPLTTASSGESGAVCLFAPSTRRHGAKSSLSKRWHLRSTPHRKVTAFQAWMEVLPPHHHPPRTIAEPGLDPLSDLFQAYPWQVAIHYDQLYYQSAARDPQLCWDAFKQDLLAWCTTGQSFRAPITYRLGPSTPDSAIGRTTQPQVALQIPPPVGHTLKQAMKFVSAIQPWNLHPGGGGGR